MNLFFPGFSADALPVAELVIEQAISFAAFSLFGIFASALYDLLRLLRRLFPCLQKEILKQDLLFWTVSGILFLRVLIYFQEGELRFFLLSGIFLGTLLWNISGSRFLLGPVQKLCFRLKYSAGHLFRKIHLKKRNISSTLNKDTENDLQD